MSNPFTPQQIEQLKAARSQGSSALNLFGAAQLALTLPYFDTLRKGELSFSAIASLLLSIYVAARGLMREFPAAIKQVYEQGTDEEKRYVLWKITLSWRALLAAWLYILGCISVVAAFYWTTKLAEARRW
jgi:hypothetical protein